MIIFVFRVVIDSILAACVISAFSNMDWISLIFWFFASSILRASAATWLTSFRVIFKSRRMFETILRWFLRVISWSEQCKIWICSSSSSNFRRSNINAVSDSAVRLETSSISFNKFFKVKLCLSFNTSKSILFLFSISSLAAFSSTLIVSIINSNWSALAFSSLTTWRRHSSSISAENFEYSIDFSRWSPLAFSSSTTWRRHSSSISVVNFASSIASLIAFCCSWAKLDFKPIMYNSCSSLSRVFVSLIAAVASVPWLKDEAWASWDLRLLISDRLVWWRVFANVLASTRAESFSTSSRLISSR